MIFILDYGLLQPEMEILEGREEYTFYESTNNTITPDKMLSDIYEVISSIKKLMNNVLFSFKLLRI